MTNGQNLLNQKLARGETTFGLWVTLESPTVSELAAALGYDWVVIDTEHGPLGFKEVVEHLRAVKGTTTTPLVRVPEIGQGVIKRMLDLGAEGLIVPQVYEAAEVERAVRLAKYPPWGIRGLGGERATEWGLSIVERAQAANRETMMVPMVETVAAGEVIDAILDVRGVDAIFFGPADFSASAGHLGAWEGPGVAERILAIKEKASARGVPCGIMATDIDNALLRKQQGFRLIGLGSDTGLLIRASRAAMKALGVEH